MHKWLGIVVLLGAFGVGCDDDNGQNMVIPDMAMQLKPDMTMVFGTKTCLQVATCAQGCMGAQACLGACVAGGTQQAQMKYGALTACGIAACTAVPDGGGAPPCSSATDTSPGCVDCITNAAQSATCGTQLQACLTDM